MAEKRKSRAPKLVPLAGYKGIYYFKDLKYDPSAARKVLEAMYREAAKNPYFSRELACTTVEKK